MGLCDKRCVTCEYFAYDRFGRSNVCVNDKSANIADFVSEDDSCSEYKYCSESGIKTVDYEPLMRDIEEQKKGILANKECYSNAEEILAEYEIIENFIKNWTFIDNTRC